MADEIMVIDAGGDVVEEHTSAEVASLAARLLGTPNILMRSSPFHVAILAAVKDSKFKVDADMLDLLEAFSRVIEPFMADVRSVAGSALTQVQPVLSPPPDDAPDWVETGDTDG